MGYFSRNWRLSSKLEQKMFSTAGELFRLVTEHSQSCNHDNCCVSKLLDILEKNSLGEPTQDMKKKNPQMTNSEVYAFG